jgi:micrococcal nuclease
LFDNPKDPKPTDGATVHSKRVRVKGRTDPDADVTVSEGNSFFDAKVRANGRFAGTTRLTLGRNDVSVTAERQDYDASDKSITVRRRRSAVQLAAVQERRAAEKARREAEKDRRIAERRQREQERAERERQRLLDEQAAEEPSGDCEPGYTPCIQPHSQGDVDCADVNGPISVTGSDPHRLDADGDGVGCE